MAETVKKAKAPAKPRKTTTAAKKKTGPTDQMGAVTSIDGGPTHDQISELARKYWAERGYTDGHHEEDWFRAEQELRAKAS